MQQKNIFIIVIILSFFNIGMGQGYFHLAAHYAPTIMEGIYCTKFGDYITNVNYDGDYIGNNNWDNLGNYNPVNNPLFPTISGDPNNSLNYTKARPLPAYVYYSVIETSTHYFICYALFHPADDFFCHTFGHENDLEGIILTVQKDSTPFGKLRLVQLQAHNWFDHYIPPNTTGMEELGSSLDGEIIIDNGSHPRVYVEGGGHGIEARECNETSLRYVYQGRAQDPDDVGSDQVGYDLLSIFSDLWEQRYNCCGSGHLFDNGSGYKGRRFSYNNIGNSFDGDNGTVYYPDHDAASAPWYWSDENDSFWNNGDWFMDPAGYQDWQFKWSEPFSIYYLIHPFLDGDIPDEIYNGKNGNTELNNGPYFIKRNVNVLTGQNLIIRSTVYIDKGKGIHADGYVRIEGSKTNPIKIIQSTDYSLGIHGTGSTIVLRNYGGIRFK